MPILLLLLLPSSACVGVIGDAGTGDEADVTGGGHAGSARVDGGDDDGGGSSGVGGFVGLGGSGGSDAGASDPGGGGSGGDSSQGGGSTTPCGDGICDGNEDCTSCPGDCGGVDIPSDFSGVQWLHTNVSSWAQTANLASVTVNGGQICLNYDKADVWPGLDHVGAFVNGNPWIFIRHNHQWYAATWEWLRHGQTCKNKSSVAGDHIKQPPFLSFQPRSGACYGFMVSGLARDSVRNVYERSQVQKIQWP